MSGLVVEQVLVELRVPKDDKMDLQRLKDSLARVMPLLTANLATRGSRRGQALTAPAGGQRRSASIEEVKPCRP